MPNDSQFKCYDGMHTGIRSSRRLYDGMYQFPSVTARSTTTGLPTATNCTICLNNPTATVRKLLPCGQVRVEMIVPRAMNW